MSFNKIHICGYLGREPELRYTPSGTAVVNISVATTEKRKNREGNLQEYTTWFRATAFGKTAELINQHFQKGSPIYLTGKLRQEQYTDREGVERYSLEVSVDGFEFVGGKEGAGNQRQAAPEQRQPQAAAVKSGKRQVNEPDDDDLAF